jgi:light-harvesting complex II chlorophyll a/b binding protein 4
MAFKLPQFGKGSTAAKPATKKAAATVKKAVGTVKKAGTVSTGTRKGGVGYRKYQGDALWLPNTTRPGWLDGSLPGDRGFDPLGLSRPSDFVQVGVDENDINAATNFKAGVDGIFQAQPDQVTETRLAPYSEVFGLQRFRECELIHGRWAMLACLGAIVAEATTGVSWAEAGKVELDGVTYAGFDLPFSITQLVWIEAILVGGAEIYRNTELDPERRLYPGGFFDPLGLASDNDPDKVFRLKTAEIKHGRLAMLAFLGYGVQALSTGEGALGSLARFGESF